MIDGKIEQNKHKDACVHPERSDKVTLVYFEQGEVYLLMFTLS